MTVLEAIIKEQKRLKKLGWKPKFRGDTGVNVCKLIDTHNIEVHEQAQALVNSWKENKDGRT